VANVYLSLVDDIFRKTKGWFNVVSTARHQPQRYGKNGELLIEWDSEKIRAHTKPKNRAQQLENGGMFENDPSST
jgi:hypothetical protein